MNSFLLQKDFLHQISNLKANKFIRWLQTCGLAYLAMDLPILHWTCLPCNGLAYLAMDLHILQWTCISCNGLAYLPLDLLCAFGPRCPLNLLSPHMASSYSRLAFLWFQPLVSLLEYTSASGCSPQGSGQSCKTNYKL